MSSESSSSGSASPPSALELRTAALALDAERASVERELDLVLLELGPSASGSLVDGDGFPRSDIDVHAVRALRGRAACLRTDLAAKAGAAEAALLRLHACGEAALAALPPLPVDAAAAAAAAAAPRRSPYIVLGQVATVAEGSPAHTGGLLVSDAVLTWGRLGPVLNVPGEEEEGGVPTLSEMGAEAKAAAQEGRAMPVRVLRAGATLQVTLRPGAWGGAGVLGCLIVPKQ